jgi:lipopolysaccharide/colanic/teichoic acid biosynthesis glycosyltransferase
LRHGFNNRPIRVWKFRTMYVDQCDPDARLVVTRGDPRVTRVGRVLRRTSIDELPQLFNVLAGSLSLVGPRPHAVDARSSRQVAFDKMVEGYSARHRLPPGITGWAQINGWRGEVSDPDSLRARVACDLFYIENWSIWFDLRILLRTPLSLLDTRRAY